METVRSIFLSVLTYIIIGYSELYFPASTALTHTQTDEHTEVIPSSQNEEDPDPVILMDPAEVAPKSQPPTIDDAFNSPIESTATSQPIKLPDKVQLIKSPASIRPIESMAAGRPDPIEASQPNVAELTLCEHLPGLPMPKPASPTGGGEDNIPAESSLTTCPETCLTQQPQLGVVAVVSVKPRPSPIFITRSSLDSASTALLHKFCERFGATEQNQFVRGETTHVVIAGERDRPRVVKRTLKFFLAVLNRCWIVNTNWIRDSLSSGELLDEDPYEIVGDTVCGDSHDGPRRARRGVPALAQAPGSRPAVDRPFAGLWLAAYNGLGLLTAADFRRLAEDGGADRVAGSPEELAAACDRVKTAVGQAKPKAIIIANHQADGFSMDDCQGVYRKYGIPVISIDWMLNCISYYRRIPISYAYRICPTLKPSGSSLSGNQA